MKINDIVRLMSNTDKYRQQSAMPQLPNGSRPVEGHVKSRIPGWQGGQPFDTGILEEYSQRVYRAPSDRAEIGASFQQEADGGIYRPEANQMRAFESAAGDLPQADRLIRVSSADRIAPPSEQSSFTAEDALINQYMKQFRIEGYFDGNSFVRTSSEPVKLMLKDQISKADLEKFKNELVEKGLGTDIDWQGVREDLAGMDVRMDNIQYFEQKADYLASRYAVLKERIESGFAGGQQEAELQKLEQIYTEAKEKLADSYAENIGGFYEDLGQLGAADDMRSSVLAVIDGKAEAYAAHLAKNDIYAQITDSDQQWLRQDDGYMAAQLRESACAVREQSREIQGQSLYSRKDLAYAGEYAKELSKQLKKPEWDTFTIKGDDRDLGKYFAEQYQALTEELGEAGVSHKLSDILKASFEPFMDKFMDELDAKIRQNQQRIEKNPWQAGLIRTNYIDRESVYSAFLSRQLS